MPDLNESYAIGIAFLVTLALAFFLIDIIPRHAGALRVAAMAVPVLVLGTMGWLFSHDLWVALIFCGLKYLGGVTVVTFTIWGTVDIYRAAHCGDETE